MCVCIHISERGTLKQHDSVNLQLFSKKIKIEGVEIRITPTLCMSLLNVASIYPREGNENIQTYFYT